MYQGLTNKPLLALALLASGCASFNLGPLLPFPSAALEGQEQAAWVIWHLYGREDMPPAVHWVMGGNLDCSTAAGLRGFSTPKGCREGWTMTPWTVSVAWRPGDFFATTALPHEYVHAKLIREHGLLGGDPNHDGPEWAQNNPNGIEQMAVNRLTELGL